MTPAALAAALTNLMGTPQVPAYTPIGAIIASGDLAQGQMTTLTGSVNAVPFEPSYLGDLNLYNYEGSMTHTVQVEFDSQTINLIQTSAPGSPGQETILNLRNVKSLTSPRIARTITVNAMEVAEIRALGSTELDSVKTRADRKLINAVRDIRSTLEYHRVGGAMGILLDADGVTVLQNYFTLLGVTQPTYNVQFGTTGSSKFITICATLLNMLEDALGNLSPSGEPPIVLCGRTFWQRFISSPDVVTAYQYFQASQQRVLPLREDLRYADFEFGGIVWRQYRGQAANGAGRFVPDAEAQLLVPGIPGTYLGLFCPPVDQASKVNTMGLPIYPTVKVLDHDAGYEIRLQSNPLHVMTRPAAAIQLYSSN
jgi:hypothetical protein